MTARPIIKSCKSGPQTANLKNWRSRFWHGTIRAINGEYITQLMMYNKPSDTSWNQTEQAAKSPSPTMKELNPWQHPQEYHNSTLPNSTQSCITCMLSNMVKITTYGATTTPSQN
jgi:hypothetical protein